MSTSLDQLRRNHPTSESPPTRSRRLPAWLVPVSILVGFGLIFALVFRDRLIPAEEVEVGRVLALPTEVADAGGEQAAPDATRVGELLFQASGWIEPDPYPVKATALIDGVVDEVHVLEGERVEKGQRLATLIDDDAELRLKRARSALDKHDADTLAHCAGILSVVEKLKTEQAHEASAEATRDAARDLLERFERSDPGAISARDVTDARLELARVAPLVEAASARVREMEHDIIKLSHETVAMQRQREALEVAVAEAELAYQRTRIEAPISGRVLRLHAVPGQKRMLGMDDPDSSTIAVLYDPEQLQARVDVPLADAAGLHVGQHAVVKSSLLSGREFRGRVTRIVGEADLTRNTLLAKVAIADPDDALRPEMICRVEFFETRRANDTATTGGRASRRMQLWVPVEAVEGETAWVVDPDSLRVESRQLELGRETRDGRRGVVSGLNANERVVMNPADLREDQRVRPRTTRRN